MAVVKFFFGMMFFLFSIIGATIVGHFSFTNAAFVPLVCFVGCLGLNMIFNVSLGFSGKQEKIIEVVKEDRMPRIVSPGSLLNEVR